MPTTPLFAGEKQIKHWLAVMDTLFSDLQHITRYTVLHMEHFVTHDPQGT